MALSKDKIQMSVYIDGEQAGKSLNQLKSNVKTLEKELAKLSPETDEFAAKLKELQEAQGPLKELQDKIKGVGDAQKEAAGNSSAFGEALFGSSELGSIAMQVLRGEMALTEAVSLGLKAAFIEIVLPLMAIAAAFEFLKGSAEVFATQKKASEDLKQNLQGTTTELEILRKQADLLEGQSLFSDEEITKGQAVLALYADNAAMVEDLTPLVADYAQATGKSMEDAAETVGVALGQEAGALEDLGVSFDATATKAERIAKMHAVLGDRVGGAAKAAMESEGGWSGLSHRFNDIQEKVGKVVVQIGNMLVPVLSFALRAFEDFINQVSLLVVVFNTVQATIYGFKVFFMGIAENIRAIAIEYFGSLGSIISGIFTLDYKKIQEGVGHLTNIGDIAKDNFAKAAKAGTDYYTELSTVQASAEEKARGHAKVLNKDQQDAAKEAAKQRAEEAKAAEQKLAGLRAQALTDELARKKAELTASANAEIAELKGSAAQKAEQERLIRANAAAEYDKFAEELRKKQADEAQKAASDALKMDEDLQKLRLEARKANLSPAEIAKFEIELEKNTKIAALKGSEAEIAEQKALLVTIYANKLNDSLAKIQADADAKKKDEDKKTLEAQLSNLDRHNKLAKGLVDAQVADGAISTETANQAKLQLDQAYLFDKLTLLKMSGVAEVAAIQGVEDEILALKRASLAKQAQMQDEQARAEIQLATQVAQKVSETAFTIMAQGQARDLKKKQDGIDKEYDAKLKAAEGDAATTEFLNEEKAAKKRQLDEQAFEDTKRMNIVQALMNGALAFTSILAQYPKFDGGFAMTAALILAGVSTAAQIAVIESQKFEQGGILQGSRHSEGGIKMVDSRTGKIVGEAEEGELILSRKFVQNNPSLSQALLRQSQNNGGAPMYESGGFVLSPPIYTSAGERVGQGASGITPEILQKAVADGIAQGLAQVSPLTANLVYSDFERTEREVNSIRKNASGG